MDRAIVDVVGVCRIAGRSGLRGEAFAARVGDVGLGFGSGQLVVVVLLIGVFVGMIAALTGRIQGRIAQFGYGIDRIEFAGETARWLKESGLTGKAFSISPGGKIESYLAYTDPQRGHLSIFAGRRRAMLTRRLNGLKSLLLGLIRRRPTIGRRPSRSSASPTWWSMFGMKATS